MPSLEYKWTVRVDAGPFLGDENDRIVWHFLSPAATPREALEMTRRAHPTAVSIDVFPRFLAAF